VKDVCGEGPLWVASENALYWTDINHFLIHRLDPATGEVRDRHFDEPVTTLAVTDRDDTLLVALGSQLISWRRATDERAPLGFQLPGWPGVRLNDGAPDPRGSFWVGSMQNNVLADGSSIDIVRSEGTLYRVEADGSAKEWKNNIGVSNTLAWSPDNKLFYFADSLRNEIYVYAYDVSTGDIANERSFFAGFERGLPDGSAIDSEGCLWNCRYGGACIVRTTPAGEIDRIVEAPTANITNCAFGGEDYRTLYITTASAGAPQDDEFAGALFSVVCDTPGLPPNRFSFGS